MGLTAAAGFLLLSGSMPLVRQMVEEYSRLLSLPVRFSLLRLLPLIGLAVACRGERPRPVGPDALSRLVDSLRGRVELATGLRFKSPPKSALRTREQVRQFLLRKLADELPTAKLEGVGDRVPNVRAPARYARPQASVAGAVQRAGSGVLRSGFGYPVRCRGSRPRSATGGGGPRDGARAAGGAPSARFHTA